jgi:hypothetical protein
MRAIAIHEHAIAGETGSEIMDPASPGFVRRWLDSLDPAERLGEVLFGLIMVLSFTLGASVELGGDRDATRELLIAALGCNTAWGVIDAALYLMNRLSERGRVYRLVRAIQDAPGDEPALAMVARELDDRISGMVGPELRGALAREMLARLRAGDPGRTRIGWADLRAALVVFLLVFLTALPAVVPFLVVQDPRIAIRTSNAVLLGLLFAAGWRWAEYTGASRWRTGLFMLVLGVLLVAIAIAMGG